MNHFTSRRSLCALLLAAGAAPGAMAADAGAYPTRPVRLIVPFVLFSLLGTYAHAQGFNLALPEVWVGLSLVLVAGLLLRSLRVSTGVAVLFCVLAALAHGYAFGEAVVGARTSAVVSYLVGLGLIQSVMLWLIATGLRKATPVVRTWLLKAGAAVSGVLGVMVLAASGF